MLMQWEDERLFVEHEASIKSFQSACEYLFLHQPGTIPFLFEVNVESSENKMLFLKFVVIIFKSAKA